MKIFSHSKMARDVARERGMALVITLILLSVTLVMAIAFLAISRRERNSVTTQTDAATARFAADSALAHAEAQIIANVLVSTNPYGYGLLVSTNFINTNGFVAAGGANITNVSYVYGSGTPLNNSADMLQNLANLFLSPRPPVFIQTNSQLAATDFRYYLDLNRNGAFENSGFISNVFIADGLIGDPQWIGVLARPDAPHGPDNFFLARYAFAAVPIGNTLDLNYIHNDVLDTNLTASDGFFRNQGVGSWEINLAAFLTDLNMNEWLPTAPPNNTYYAYNQPLGSANSGHAFEDARALLSWRYASTYGSLNTVANLFANNGLPLESDGIDQYANGLLMTGLQLPIDNDKANNIWAGADNTNHYFDLTVDLFDQNKTGTGVSLAQIAAGNYFTARLLHAGTNISTYDRYTFYRLLSQLGTDSEPESKMNLNYRNMTNGIIVPGMETNLISWSAIEFFTNAADRMLRAYTTNWFKGDPTNYLATYYGIPNYVYYYTDSSGFVHMNDPTGIGLTNVPFFGMTNQIPGFGVTNIPVWVSNKFVYSSAMQRLLQLAANMYDATTNRYYDSSGMPLPTIFQPVFNKLANGSTYDVYISGFIEFTNSGIVLANTQPLDLRDSTDLGNLLPFNLVYGVPLIIGAKKGLPNFNEFALESIFTVERKVQLTRSSTNITVAPLNTYKLNQMFNCGAAMRFGVECWNSYVSNYTRATTIRIANKMQMVLTNDEGMTPRQFPPNTVISSVILTNQNPGDYWIGFANGDENSLVFTNVDATLLPSATYKFSIADFVIITNGYTETYETNVNIPSDAWPKYPQPQWGLINTNNIQVVMIDDTTDRAIDYVQFIGPSKGRDLMREITDANKKNYSDFWRTGGATSAVLNITIPSGLHTQLDASQIYNSALWSGQNKIQVEKQIDGFRKFIHLSSLYGNGTDLYGSTNLEIQVPYTPTAVTIDYTTWQANDPLVHYLASDLRFATEPAGGTLTNGINQWTSTNVPPPPNVGKLNDRYEPWGINTSIQNDPLSDHNAFNIAYKDSLATNSDAWDFPTDKFPAIGWLGRVHRGTPWQTVFLKATNLFDYVETNTAEQVIAGTNTWKNITGNTKSFDAINAMPFQDRLLFDLFTTSPNDNSMRGQLSVNVSANSHEPDAALAAWSALFSGMVVLTNDPVTGTLSWTNIQPAGLDGLNSTLGQVVKGIYDTRTNFVNSDGLKGVFEHVGDILAVPQFSEKSPFVNTSAQDPNGNPIYPNDEVLEWLPQRAMSLLRVSSAPRYALYCYGQTLKPAQNSLSTSSTTLADGRNAFGMCTNYQVVSETAVRVLVHVEDEKTSHPRIVVDSYNVLPPD